MLKNSGEKVSAVASDVASTVKRKAIGAALTIGDAATYIGDETVKRYKQARQRVLPVGRNNPATLDDIGDALVTAHSHLHLVLLK